MSANMVQYSFTSTETRRLVRTDSPGRPPLLSHSSWTMTQSINFDLSLLARLAPPTSTSGALKNITCVRTHSSNCTGPKALDHSFGIHHGHVLCLPYSGTLNSLQASYPREGGGGCGLYAGQYWLAEAHLSLSQRVTRGHWAFQWVFNSTFQKRLPSYTAGV